MAPARARIFHYGWVRHPRFMQAKVREFWSHRRSLEEVEREYGGREEFDYGPLGRLPEYRGTHPAVMSERIAAMDWADRLRLEDPPGLERRQRHKDERLKYRLLTGVTRLTGHRPEPQEPRPRAERVTGGGLSSTTAVITFVR